MNAAAPRSANNAPGPFPFEDLTNTVRLLDLTNAVRLSDLTNAVRLFLALLDNSMGGLGWVFGICLVLY